MKLFNAIQLMAIFAATPFAIYYCKDAIFFGHTVVTWVLIAIYIGGFGALSALLADNIS